MIRTLHEGLLADGDAVPISKLCNWFGVPRHMVYYKPTKAARKLDDKFVTPIKAMIEENPSFGYRTAAYLLTQAAKSSRGAMALSSRHQSTRPW